MRKYLELGRIAFIFGRIFKNDRRHPGVLVEVRKTTAVDIIWNMIKLKVISKDDLNDFLDELKQEMERRTGALEYEMFEHQAVYTVDEIEDSDLWNHENGIGAKNLFLRDGSGKHHFLVIIREDKQADLKKVRDEIGSSRLSFVSAERLMKYLNIEPGSVSPLGILNDKECVVPVFFDEDLKEYEYIAVHPNDNTATIWMKLTDLLDVIKMHGNQVNFISV